MYKVTKRDCPMFGIGPYVCEFICDTASDISTLPTSISEGTGGKTAYDNQKCASGSIAIVAENGAESKQYMLNNQDIWCPYSVASGSSDSVLEEAKAYTDSEIADLINGAPTTRDTLKEIADAMAENQTVVEALDAAIGSKANKTDIPTKVSQLENDSGYLTEHQDLSEYAKKTEIPTELPADGGNADTVKSIREDIRYIDIFSTSLSCDHACWNKNCCVTGQSVDPDGDAYIINAPESSDALWYEVMTIGNIAGLSRAYQIAHGCYGHQRKSFIRYKHDDVWSDWKNIADGGNADTLDGLHANEIATNPNLLINPDFKINQRGNTDFSVSYHTGSPIPQSQVYTVDRWRIMEGRANISNGKYVLNGTIIQVLENSIGGNFTATVSVESGTATASYNDSTKTFTIVGNSAVLNWAKLEHGSVATPFIPPDPTTELIKCQRFYYIIGGKTTANDDYYEPIGYGMNTSSNKVTIFLPIIMRQIPTINHSGIVLNTTFKTGPGTTTGYAGITGITASIYEHGIKLIVTGSNGDGLVIGRFAELLISAPGKESGSHFALDAEIY